MDTSLNGLVGAYGNWTCRCYDGNYYVCDVFNNGIHSNLKLSLDISLALARALDWCEIGIHTIPNYLIVSGIIKEVRKQVNEETPFDTIFWLFVDHFTIKD